MRRWNEHTCSLMELWARGSGSEPSSLSRMRLQISTAYLFRSSITKRTRHAWPREWARTLDITVFELQKWTDVLTFGRLVGRFLLCTGVDRGRTCSFAVVCEEFETQFNALETSCLPLSAVGFSWIKSSNTLHDRNSVHSAPLNVRRYLVLIVKMRFIFVRSSSYRTESFFSMWSVCLAMAWHNSRNSRWACE